jgi:hypothetical protein
LSEALQIGGFGYAINDDPTLTDGEGVSLGQRKNQLSRRLRLARKHNNPGGTRADEYYSSGNSESFNATGSAAGLSNDAQRDFQRLMQQQQQQQAAAVSKKPTPAGNNKMAARALQMKRDQADLGDLSDDEVNPYAPADYQQDEQAKRPRIAKFHPDFAPLFVPPASSVRNGATPKGGEPTAAVPPSNLAAPLNMNIGVNGVGVDPRVPTAASMPQQSLFAQQLANPYAVAQQNQSRPSSVAITSLTHSAQAVGLTLEQLAMHLASDTSSLAKILAENAAADAQSKKMDLAQRLFETDIKALYSKSLLMAGFDPRDCQQNTPLFQEFARKAWQGEAKRLKTTLGVGAGAGDFSFDELDKAATGEESTSLGKEIDEEHDHAHDHDHGEQGGEKPAAPGCDSRHIHRIDGQCGHKAIIHKPKDGNAHIDFVVGDKVECYHGIEPMGKNVDAAWPSRYKCKEAGEHKGCGTENCKDLPADANIPKVFELSEIDLHDPEWNYDVGGSIDGGVAGLFRLGGRSDDNSITFV